MKANPYTTKDEFEKALHDHQAAKDEMKSEQIERLLLTATFVFKRVTDNTTIQD